jgi:hypothetical protein
MIFPCSISHLPDGRNGKGPNVMLSNIHVKILNYAELKCSSRSRAYERIEYGVLTSGKKVRQ